MNILKRATMGSALILSILTTGASVHATHEFPAHTPLPTEHTQTLDISAQVRLEYRIKILDQNGHDQVDPLLHSTDQNVGTLEVAIDSGTECQVKFTSLNMGGRY